MELRIARIDEYKQIKALYLSAFPPNERAPFAFIKLRAIQNRATMLVAEEDGELVGFAYTVSHGTSVYLFFFAVAESKRGGGRGGEILRLLKARYGEKRIFLAREPLDGTAENSAERLARQSFYVHNGFIDLPLQIREAGVVYDLMCTGADFDPADYGALMKKWAGSIVLRLVRMEIVR